MLFINSFLEACKAASIMTSTTFCKQVLKSANYADDGNVFAALFQCKMSALPSFTMQDKGYLGYW
jgi:hypothetical protein